MFILSKDELIQGFEIQPNTLINDDCLNAMKFIPDGSISMILADPPYASTACKWDSIIPLEPMWEQLKRIIKPNGAIVLFGQEPFSSILRTSNLNMFKYDWYWVKSRKNGFVHAKGMPLKETETVSVFSGGSIRRNSNNPMVYNPQNVIPFTKKRVNYVKTTSAYSGGHEVGTEYEQKGYGYPTNLIPFKNESPKTQVHPTQKPVALMEYLINTYTLEGETVLDFTAGSFTTGVACVNLNRRFIMIEKDPYYFKIGSERVERAFSEKGIN